MDTEGVDYGGVGAEAGVRSNLQSSILWVVRRFTFACGSEYSPIRMGLESGCT